MKERMLSHSRIRSRECGSMFSFVVVLGRGVNFAFVSIFLVQSGYRQEDLVVLYPEISLACFINLQF